MRVAHDDTLDASHGAILYLEDVSVSFDGFRALNRLTLDISVGELRCIIGPNGAGKTTMMDVITGKTRPGSGRVWFGQRHDLALLSEHQIARAGIGRKFQRPTVFESHTVFENLELALRMDKRVRACLFARLERPIPFDSHDGEPVDLLFFLLAPEQAGGDHLKALARISRLIRDPATLEGLRNAKDVNELRLVLTKPLTSNAA